MHASGDDVMLHEPRYWEHAVKPHAYAMKLQEQQGTYKHPSDCTL